MKDGLSWLSAMLYTNAKTLSIVIFLVGISWLIEYCRPARNNVGLKARIENIAMFALLLLGLSILPWLANILSSFLPKVALIDHVFPGWKHEGAIGGIIATLIYALVWDFFQYWTHRAQHAFPLLWYFHRIHHSDRSMNASTSARQSLGGALLGYFLVHIPTLVICGANLLPYIGSIILFSGWGYLNHANLRVPFGPMSYLLSGPQVHRLHHGLARDYHDRNYAAFFPFIDVLFGSFRLPGRDEWPETGIENDTTPNSLLEKVFLPWRGKVHAD
jgi:sterol desaturase/sphingolipid hydroxylase (fatty acid hydroxylase superfamily)